MSETTKPDSVPTSTSTATATAPDPSATIAGTAAAGRPRLLVLDGHSMAFRAFYALPAENFATSSGQHTNAVHGFTSMLINLIKDQKPTHVAVAFDVSDDTTFRKAEYSEYKGGRNETPPEFRGQIDLIDQVMAAWGIKTIKMPGYEADDILATLAARGEAAGYEVLLVSGDRDAFQLITDNVFVLYPKQGFPTFPAWTRQPSKRSTSFPLPLLRSRRAGRGVRRQPRRRSRRRPQDRSQVDQPLRRPGRDPGEPGFHRRQGRWSPPGKHRRRQAQSPPQPAPGRP